MAKLLKREIGEHDTNPPAPKLNSPRGKATSKKETKFSESYLVERYKLVEGDFLIHMTETMAAKVITFFGVIEKLGGDCEWCVWKDIIMVSFESASVKTAFTLPLGTDNTDIITVWNRKNTASPNFTFVCQMKTLVTNMNTVKKCAKNPSVILKYNDNEQKIELFGDRHQGVEPDGHVSFPLKWDDFDRYKSVVGYFHKVFVYGSKVTVLSSAINQKYQIVKKCYNSTPIAKKDADSEVVWIMKKNDSNGPRLNLGTKNNLVEASFPIQNSSSTPNKGCILETTSDKADGYKADAEYTFTGCIKGEHFQQIASLSSAVEYLQFYFPSHEDYGCIVVEAESLMCDGSSNPIGPKARFAIPIYTTNTDAASIIVANPNKRAYIMESMDPIDRKKPQPKGDNPDNNSTLAQQPTRISNDEEEESPKNTKEKKDATSSKKRRQESDTEESGVEEKKKRRKSNKKKDAFINTCGRCKTKMTETAEYCDDCLDAMLDGQDEGDELDDFVVNDEEEEEPKQEEEGTGDEFGFFETKGNKEKKKLHRRRVYPDDE